MTQKPNNSKELIREFLLNFQNDLTSNLENLDGKAKFIEDKWTNPELGGGKTRVLSNGDLFEQGGVNFSEISKDQVPESLLGHKPELKDQKFWGAGVSMVLHPKSPFLLKWVSIHPSSGFLLKMKVLDLNLMNIAHQIF